VQLLLQIVQVLHLHYLHYTSFLADRLIIDSWKFLSCVLNMLKMLMECVMLFSFNMSRFPIAFRTLMT